MSKRAGRPQEGSRTSHWRAGHHRKVAGSSQEDRRKVAGGLQVGRKERKVAGRMLKGRRKVTGGFQEFRRRVARMSLEGERGYRTVKVTGMSQEDRWKVAAGAGRQTNRQTDR